VRVRVKICGVTRPEDGLLAAREGADAIGMVFWSRSPRAVSISRAREIRAVLPPFVTPVALFVNPSAEEVDTVIAEVRPALLQFHGDEAASFCNGFGLPYVKALKVGKGGLGVAELGAHPNACGLLLDSHDPIRVGGTGRPFDWSLVPGSLNRPIIAAGGLTAQNVEEAIRRLRPWAVDVSSGVEHSPGLKDAARLRAFMRCVAAANCGSNDPDTETLAAEREKP